MGGLVKGGGGGGMHRFRSLSSKARHRFQRAIAE